MVEKTIEGLESIIAKKDGQIASLTSKIDETNENLNHSLDKVVKLEKKVKEFEDLEREAIIETAHSLKADYEVEGKSNDRLRNFIEDFKSGMEEMEHSMKKKSPKAPSASGNSKDDVQDGNARAMDILNGRG